MEELNRKQQKAVELEGNVVIIAGPGTGKTRTLTHKIAYLLQEKQVNSTEIVALTFTKKAATEMRERVEELISNSEFLISKQPPNSNDSMFKQDQFPSIGTFHSLAFKILEEGGYEPNLASEKQLAEIMREICGNYSGLCKQLEKKDISRYISLYKTGFELDTKKGFDDLIDDYNSRLNKRGLMDYDDLLIKAMDIVKKESIVFKHVLVDEFQDTNNLQYSLIKQLIDKKGDLFVIGDPRQSIYGFRGSNEKIFENFKKDFPEARQILLDKNYRSGANLIKSSLSLFKDPIKLKSNKKEEGEVKLVETYNQYSEADWILKEINEKVGGIDLNFAAEVDLEKQTHSFADFAVVYRIHNLNRILEKKFYEFGIPFQVIGGDSLYKQKQIKFIILALKYQAHNASMKLSGGKSSRFIEVENPEEYLVRMKGLKAADDSVSLTKEKLKKIDIDKKLSEVVKQIIDLFALEKTLEGRDIEKQNLKEFSGSTLRFDNQEEGLSRFLEHMKYLQEHEYYDERADKVTLMSMHTAKGLEFPFVYIIGFEHGFIPYKRSIEEGNLDEEKRLLYVAMTRAEEGLQLLYSQRRYGQRSKISRFAKSLDKNSVQRIKDKQIEKIKQRIERSKKKQLDLF